MEGHGVTGSIGVGVGTGSNLVPEVFEQVEKMLPKFSSYTSTVEIAEEKFPGVDLSDLKAEDYVDKASAKVGYPLVEEAPDVELGSAIPKVAVEDEGASIAFPVSVSINSP
ncbi:hypothetical protein CJ030_MR2G022348 [Morella rubra]|uniref:Uncharacterized protein n=1 Tax=Morella rubra TaxID=262757 RepID=A0A6A1WCP0_9ROSI|nr:hypothetical protein CJ030_MR2G022348 [Morella rubra]